jgi:sugar phosphate isomerase/epimerase
MSTGDVMRENPLGLEYMTLLGAHPLHFIRTAAAAGCTYVSLRPAQLPHAPAGSPPYSLLDDPNLRGEVVSTLEEHGVGIGLFDGLGVAEGQSVERHGRSLELMPELGVTRVNTVSRDPDLARTTDEMGRLVQMAAEYDITVTVEPCPPLTVGTLAQALAVIDQVALPNFKLLIDTMHVSRSGEASMVSDLDPDLVDYVHICDGPMAMPANAQQYLDEARNERMIPGEGEMPLVEILSGLRPDVIVSTEVPLSARREAGMPDLERVQLALEGTKRTLGLVGE